MRQHTLGWFSSYDYCNLHKKIYNVFYDKSTMRTLQKRIRNIFSLVQKKETSFLFSFLQIRLESNFAGVLERQKNTFLQKAKQRCFWFKKWTMEGWKKNRQRWIYSYLESKTSLFGFSWICSRTPLSNGTTYRKNFNSYGGSTS